MFDKAISQDYHFLCLLWSVIFPRSCVGSIVTKFYWRLYLFGLILTWCTWIITTLISFTDFIGRITIYVCTYNILAICVITNWPFTSLEIFLLFSIDFFPPKLLLFFLTWKIKLIYTLLIRCKFMCCSQHFTTYLLSLK